MLWRDFDIEPENVQFVPDWKLDIIISRMHRWVQLCDNAGQSAGGGRVDANGVRHVTFAEAVAAGIIPPSGGAMTGAVNAAAA